MKVQTTTTTPIVCNPTVPVEIVLFYNLFSYTLYRFTFVDYDREEDLASRLTEFERQAIVEIEDYDSDEHFVSRLTEFERQAMVEIVQRQKLLLEVE